MGRAIAEMSYVQGARVLELVPEFLSSPSYNTSSVQFLTVGSWHNASILWLHSKAMRLL